MKLFLDLYTLIPHHPGDYQCHFPLLMEPVYEEHNESKNFGRGKSHFLVSQL